MAETDRRDIRGVMPFLTIREDRAREALDFYVQAFAAEVVGANAARDGERIMQAELRINGGPLMPSASSPSSWAARSRPRPE